MKPILFVVATQSTKADFPATPYGKYMERYANQPGVTHEIAYENTKGLPTLYNEYLTDKWKGHLIVFVHDDVEIRDGGICESLREAHQHFDVVGLAGGRVHSKPPAAPYLWHYMTEERSGIVAHATHGTALTSVCFGPTPARVDILDGLFISVDVDKILACECRFDDEFKFHFYDITFCHRAIKAGLTLGTWPIFVVHHGLGDSYNSPEWASSQVKYQLKYATHR